MSDYRKSITFQAKLDTSEFGPTIENMKKQFSEVTGTMNTRQAQAQTAARLSQQGYGSVMGMPKATDIQKSRREMDGFIREQAQQQEKIYKIIERQKDKVERLESIKKSMLRDSKEELAVEQKLIAAKESLIRLNERYARGDKTLNQAITMQGGGMPPGGGGNNNNLLNGADWSGVMPPKGGGMGGFGKGIASVSAVIAGVAKAVDTLAGFPMRLEEAKGAAVQSFVGRDVSAIQSGNQTFEMPWMQERAKAAEMAKSKRFWNRITDTGMGLAGVGGIVGGGLLAAGAGWTGVGAAAGAAGIAGGSAILSNDRYRSAINPFSDAYSKLLDKEQGQDTFATLEALKEQDPMKRAAIERLQSRYQGDLATQRMMGMGNQEFAGKGGFQETANQAGFTGDMAAAMATQIQGAGGSTRGMRGLSTLALQAQRGYDLTNAGNVLGKISGGAGGAEASQAVFRKIMEESVKAGLDKSEFREEQRRFADTTADILASAGVKTAEDAERTLQGFTRFLGNEPTMKEMTGAKAAYEEAQGETAETQGRGGVLQFAGMLKNPVLRKLGVRGMSALSEIPSQDLTSTNPLIIAEASRAGVKPQELVEQLKNNKQEQRQIAVGLDPEKMKSLQTYMEKRGKGDLNLTSEDLSKMQTGTAEDRAQYEQYMKVQEAAAVRSDYKDMQKRQAVVLGLMRGEEVPGGPKGPGVMGPAAGGYEQKMAVPAEQRIEEGVVRAAGQQAQAMLENFRNFTSVINPATDALKQFIDVLMGVKTAVPTGIPASDALSRYRAAAPNFMNQNQGGKPSPAGK